MTFLFACVLVGPPSFMAGWFANAYWKKTSLRERLSNPEPSKHVFDILFGLLVVAVIGNIIYTNVSDKATEERIAVSEARQNDRNTNQLACLSETFQEFLIGNQKLREASARRDNALVGSKKALRDLVFLRVIQGKADGPDVRAAAQAYLAQTHDFIRASEQLREARSGYVLPNFEKACGIVP